MIQFLALFIGFIFVISVVLGIWLYGLLAPKPKPKAPEPSSQVLERTEFIEPVCFRRVEPFYRSQDPSWRRLMETCGRGFSQAGVRLIYFVHGTFAGNDPFQIIESIRGVAPAFSGRLLGAFEKLQHRQVKKLLKGLGQLHTRICWTVCPSPR